MPDEADDQGVDVPLTVIERVDDDSDGTRYVHVWLASEQNHVLSRECWCQPLVKARESGRVFVIHSLDSIRAYPRNAGSGGPS